MVTIERVESRADLSQALANLNATAKKLSRSGKVGTATERYATLHENINNLVTAWAEAES